MKTLLLTFVAVYNELVAVYAVSSIPAENFGQKEPHLVEIQGHDGEAYKIDLQAEPNLRVLDDVMRNPANNRYLLYTRRNSWYPQELQIKNANSITRSNFNASNPTVVISHGWTSSMYSEINPTIRNAYISKSDVNVIVLDWSRLANSDYVTAAAGVPAVGRGLGQFLNFLNQVTGAPFARMHLVGASLGAHLVGNAGRELGGGVARITGLDPAGILWHSNINRLSASDAVYVECIHTDDFLGIGTALGDVDFFPNGGKSQPGCLTNICNHDRAWQLFAATVSFNHLVGQQCETSLQITWNTCRGPSLPMGNDDLNKRGSGLYRINTSSHYPF